MLSKLNQLVFSNKQIPFEKFRIICFLLYKGYFRLLLDELKRRIYSDEIYYWLRRDLNEPFKPANARIPIQIRLLSNADIPKLLNLNETGYNSADVIEQVKRLQFLKADIRTCYVAASQDDCPCFMQWLIVPKENKKLQAYFKGILPLLAPDEVLLDYVYIPPEYRRKSIMPFAMSEVAQKGKSLGARWAITYVRDSNTASIKGCLRAGFIIYKKHIVIWRMFKRHCTFLPLDAAANGFYQD